MWISQNKITTSNFCSGYELGGCCSSLLSYLMPDQLLLCSQLRACDLGGEIEEAENFLKTTHWVLGKTGEPSLGNRQKWRDGGWGETDMISEEWSFERAAAVVSGRHRALEVLLPMTWSKWFQEHQQADLRLLCPCPRQQGSARAGVWSFWLPL